MRGFLLICLAVTATVAVENCDVGKQLIDKVDSRIFSGVWREAYRKPKESSTGNKSCPVREVIPIADEEFDIVSSAWSLKRGEMKWNQTMHVVDGRNMNISYDDNPQHNVLFYVLAYSVENGFIIFGGCPWWNEDKQNVWLLFREWPASENSMKAAVEALEKTGNELKDFSPVCEKA